MRYLKSVLFIVLVSVFAVQANANILLPTSLVQKQKKEVPNNVIEIIHVGHNVEISNVTNEQVQLTLICSINGEISTNYISPDSNLTLSDLAPGNYELKAESTLGIEIVSIIIL